MPSPENDKVIFVKGWNESEINQIISDFIEQNESDAYPAFTIEAHKQSEHLHRLTFPEDIHPMLFTFLVNYLAYPFDLDLTNRSIIIAGKMTLTSTFADLDPQFVGKTAIFYIPENDQDADVVYMQTESGVTLTNSFSDLAWRKVNDARLSKAVKSLLADH